MKFDNRGNIVVVWIKGRMDAVTAPQFEMECAEQLSAEGFLLVADLSQVEYISSAGLRSILQIAKKLQRSGGRIRFCGLSGMVQSIFSISGFSAIFPVFESLGQALVDCER
jgi:anti-anti-sigma factor